MPVSKKRKANRDHSRAVQSQRPALAQPVRSRPPPLKRLLATIGNNGKADAADFCAFVDAGFPHSDHLSGRRLAQSMHRISDTLLLPYRAASAVRKTLGVAALAGVN